MIQPGIFSNSNYPKPIIPLYTLPSDNQLPGFFRQNNFNKNNMKNPKKAELKEEATSDATICATPTADNGGGFEDLPPYPSPFEEGEAVIANHKGYYYLAKVEKVMFEKDWRYFIHYMGWSKSWDEWIRVDLVLKHTQENLKKVTYDKNKTTEKYAKTGRSSQVKMVVTSDCSPIKQRNNSSPLVRKRKRDQIENKVKEYDSVEKLANISIPPMLKKQLVDDFKFINHRDELVRLPRTPNVEAIIEKYCAHRVKEGMIAKSVGDVMNGLCLYFNKALPVLLLYNKERQQFQDAITDNSSQPLPSAVYGAEHLLRLFVKLPVLLYEQRVEEQTLKVLHQNFLHFLKFLQKNQGLFFLSTYQVPVNTERCADEDHH